MLIVMKMVVVWSLGCEILLLADVLPTWRELLYVLVAVLRIVVALAVVSVVVVAELVLYMALILDVVVSILVVVMAYWLVGLVVCRCSSLYGLVLMVVHWLLR